MANTFIQNSILITLLIFTLTLPSLVFGEDGVLAKREQYSLRQTDINNMLLAGENIAGHTFNQEEKQALQNWAITLFQRETALDGVMSAFNKYHRYLQLAGKHQGNPDLQALIWHHCYREMAFKWRFPRYQDGQQTLLDVIQRYNPILKRQEHGQLILTQNSPLIHEQDGYFLSKPVLTALQTVAQFLARQQISPEDMNGLQQWALADFKNTPQQSSIAYGHFLDEVVPQALSPASRHTQEAFRHKTYLSYFFLFKADPLSQQWNTDLMDIAAKYNPPLAIDEKHQQMVTQSELNDLLGTAWYFSNQLQLGVSLTPAYNQAERQQLINRFVNRSNLHASAINSAYLLRSQAFWEGLSAIERQQLSSQIRQNYQQHGNIWQALQPLFSRLDGLIQLENQQQAIQQQIMANLLLQQLQINQQIYNNVMQSYRESGDRISQAISDQSTRQSVQITGGKVLETHRNHFVIESRDGVRYNITR